MKAAIYARYSSENQSEKSIEDQIRVCQKHAQEKGLAVNERHIYADEAISGTVLNRPGLQALEEAAAKSEFKTVLVDDLSRLSRSNHQMLSLVLKFNFWHISIISVSDGINTEDENAKLGIQLRGLVNELYLDDLRKKTMRGLEGQKLRGFSAGERVYGYSSLPSGEIRLRSGTLKHEGMIHQINLDEASVVQRIFKEFSEHKSINKIVRIGFHQSDAFQEDGTNPRSPESFRTKNISAIGTGGKQSLFRIQSAARRSPYLDRRRNESPYLGRI
jgi:DNA invertase Pin-like site-specific DNA recombinase